MYTRELCRGRTADEQPIPILRASVFGRSFITLCIKVSDAENIHLYCLDAHEAQRMPDLRTWNLAPPIPFPVLP